MNKVDARPEGDISHFSVQQMEPIISAFESSDILMNGDGEPGQDIVEGDIDGLGFKVRFPHLRKGKHAMVGIVDLNYPNGEVFSVVLRRNDYDAKRYAKLAETHPFVLGYLPKQYGTVGEWAVLERLHGLELGELTDRLREDPEFLRKYARNAYQLIAQAAQNGLSLQDVHFVDGHNAMVDPTNASIRLVEQASLAPSPEYYTPTEVIVKDLMSQVVKGSLPEQYQYDFSIALIQEALAHLSADELFIRGRVIGTDHPDYMEIWDMYHRKVHYIPDEASKDLPWYKLPQRGDPPPNPGPIGWHENGVTERFSDDFIQAVIGEDSEKVRDIVDSGKFKEQVTDPSDSRAKPILMKPSEN